VVQDSRFLEDLIRHANSGSKLADVSFVCAIDMCRAGFRIAPGGELPLRHIAADIAHEIKVPSVIFERPCTQLIDVQTSLLTSAKQRPFWDSFDEIDVGTYAEALVAVFRFLPEDESIPLFIACLEPERSDAVKICAIKGASILSSEVCVYSESDESHLMGLSGRSSPVAAFT
jgi:hypothetical protein